MIDDDDENRPFCPSCHKAYSDHDGLIRTCHDLQQAKKSIKLLRDALQHIIAHQELIGGTMAHTSSTLAIATAAIAKAVKDD